jgi:hypothetical protein
MDCLAGAVVILWGLCLLLGVGLLGLLLFRGSLCGGLRRKWAGDKSIQCKALEHDGALGAEPSVCYLRTVSLRQPDACDGLMIAEKMGQVGKMVKIYKSTDFYA